MRSYHGGVLLACLVIPVALAPLGAQGDKAAAHDQVARLDSIGDPLPEGVFYRLGTVRLRHAGLRAISFSADSTRLLTQGNWGEPRVWDVASGRLLQALPLSDRAIIASPDDRHCVVSTSGGIVLVDKATGKTLHTWAHPCGWRSVAFTPDGKALLAVAANRGVHRLNVATCQEEARQELEAPAELSKVEFYWQLSQDGTVAAGCYSLDNKTGRWWLWDTATGKAWGCLVTIQPHQAWLSRDGMLLAVMDSYGGFEVWDALSGKRLLPKPSGQTKDIPTRVHSFAFHPDGKTLALASSSTVRLLDLTTAKELWTRDLPPGQNVHLMSFSPDGKCLAVGHGNAILLLESAKGVDTGFTRQDPGQFWGPTGESAPRFAGAGHVLLVGRGWGITAREAATGKELHNFAATRLQGVSWDGSIVTFVADASAEMRAVEAETGKQLWLRPWSSSKSEVCFAPDGKSAGLLAKTEGKVHVVEARTGRAIETLVAPSAVVDADERMGLAVSSDLKVAALSPPGRGGIQVWDIAAGKIIRHWEWPERWDHCLLHFIGNTRHLVAHATGTRFAWKAGRVRLPDTYQVEWTCIWDTATGKKLHSFTEKFLGLSPDGRWLALAKDSIIQLRNTETGRVQCMVPWYVFGGFSADSHTLLAIDPVNQELGLWDVATGVLLRSWRDPALTFQGAALSPDGRTLSATTDQGVVLVCDVTGLASAPGKLPSLNLDAAEIETLWNDLASADGIRSHAAYWKLAAGGASTVSALKLRLHPVHRLDANLSKELIADLDSVRYAVRQQATLKLETLESAWPALVEALAQRPAPELRLRIEAIQAKLTEMPWDEEFVRSWRAVRVLAEIGTPDARRHLQALADGVPQARLTKAARTALTR